MGPLAPVLSTMLLQMWPARRHQELLLDLGERKSWTDADRAAAVNRLADWLCVELGLSSNLSPATRRSGPAGRGPLPAVHLADVGRAEGVGSARTALAKVAGTTPKTLANSLASGLVSSRRDHRWIRLLRRAERGDIRLDALLFHRRSTATITLELAERGNRDDLDAGDALLLLSLVGLWQRRRPKHESRGARKAHLPRRVLPKPFVGLASEAVLPSQLRNLADAASGWPPTQRRLILAVGLDAALFEAHLAPHRARRPRVPESAPGNIWVRAIEAFMAHPAVAAALETHDRDLFVWRVGRMRAYQQGLEALTTPAPLIDSPHILLATAIDDARGGRFTKSRFAAGGPGYAMLLPQARRLGLLEEA